MELAQVEDATAGTGGLLSDLPLQDQYAKQSCDENGDNDILSLLGDLSNKSAGVWIRYFSDDVGYYSNAHWATVTGIVTDDTATDFREKYKGIFLADSDDYTVRSDAYSEDTPEERARLAAEAPNIYTYFTLGWENIAGDNTWVIVDSSVEPIKRVISAIRCLADIDTLNRTSSDDGNDDDNSSSDDNTQLVTYRDQAIDIIKTFMADNDMLVFSPNVGRYVQGNDEEYTIYVRNYRTSLLNVFLDGERLSENTANYRVDELDGGLFRIRLSKELMNTLKKGNHDLLLDFNAIDDAGISISVE